MTIKVPPDNSEIIESIDRLSKQVNVIEESATTLTESQIWVKFAISSLNTELEKQAHSIYLLSTTDNIRFFEWPITSAIIGSIVAVTAAFLLNLLYWRHRRHSEKFNSLARRLQKTVEDLEQIAVDYWLSAPQKGEEEKEKLKEIKIKSQLALARSIGKILTDSPNSKHSSSLQKITIFNDVIFDMITNDKFEIQSRHPDPILAQKISSRCSKVKSVLLKLTYSQ